MLINCPDCKRQISDQAPACPNCGRPAEKGTPFTFDTPEGPKTIRIVMPDLRPKCPMCGGVMIRLTASTRGEVLATGNFFGSIGKSMRCEGCGHLA